MVTHGLSHGYNVNKFRLLMTSNTVGSVSCRVKTLKAVSKPDADIKKLRVDLELSVQKSLQDQKVSTTVLPESTQLGIVKSTRSKATKAPSSAPRRVTRSQTASSAPQV